MKFNGKRHGEQNVRRSARAGGDHGPGRRDGLNKRGEE